MPLNGGRPPKAEAGARQSVAGVRRVDAAWHLPAHQPLARRVRVLLLLCRG
jgi:hypothetical protein